MLKNYGARSWGRAGGGVVVCGGDAGARQKRWFRGGSGAGFTQAV